MKTTINLTVILSLILTLSISEVKAQNSFFLDKAGMEAEYVVKDAKGTVLSYAKTTVVDVNKKDSKNFTATYKTEVFDAKKKSLGDPTTSTTEVVDGVVVFDPVAAMGEAGKDVEVKGTFSSFPAELEVGQDLGDYSYTMKMNGMNTTVSGKGKVTAKESVSTEAGSFDCYKVESETSTKVMMNNAKAKSTSWYAKGAGAVKTETYDKKGKVQSTMELVSLKK